MSNNNFNKLYYSIGEVGRILQLDQHVLRYWETEFKELSPRKRKNGKRIYREGDIEIIRQIKKLLYEDKYTIEGARRRLGKESKNQSKTGQLFDNNDKEGSNLLATIRRDLEELKTIINS